MRCMCRNETLCLRRFWVFRYSQGLITLGLDGSPALTNAWNALVLVHLLSSNGALTSSLLSGKPSLCSTGKLNSKFAAKSAPCTIYKRGILRCLYLSERGATPLTPHFTPLKKNLGRIGKREGRRTTSKRSRTCNIRRRVYYTDHKRKLGAESVEFRDL